MAVFSRSVFRSLKPGFHVIADDRKSQIASNRRRSQKRTFPYNLKNRRADRGHTFRSAEMWNKHAQLQTKTCRNNMEDIEGDFCFKRTYFFCLCWSAGVPSSKAVENIGNGFVVSSYKDKNLEISTRWSKNFALLTENTSSDIWECLLNGLTICCPWLPPL